MRLGRLHLGGGEVKFGTKVKFRSTKLTIDHLYELCSGFATVRLVAELTGLTGTGTRSGFRTQGRRLGLKILNDIIKTS